MQIQKQIGRQVSVFGFFFFLFKKHWAWELPGGPGVRTQRFHRHGAGSIPGQGTKILLARRHGHRKALSRDASSHTAKETEVSLRDFVALRSPIRMYGTAIWGTTELVRSLPSSPRPKAPGATRRWAPGHTEWSRSPPVLAQGPEKGAPSAQSAVHLLFSALSPHTPNPKGSWGNPQHERVGAKVLSRGYLFSKQ